MTDVLSITAKWSGRSDTLDAPRSWSVAQLLAALKSQFGMDTIKLIGLTKGKMPEPDVLLSALHPPGAQLKLMLIGQARDAMTAMGEQESLFEVQRIAEEAQAAENARARAAYEAAAAERYARQQAEEAVRAREREEQRRIQQAEWEERRRVEDAARLERELASEQDVQRVISLELLAFHSPALDVSQKILLPPHCLQDIINAKISFPLTFQAFTPENMDAVAAESSAAAATAAAAAASASAAASGSAMQDEAGLSLTSEATTLSIPHPVEGAAMPILSPLVAYTAVQDFTAPPNTVSVPMSLLRALHVQEGAKLRLTNVNLKKAVHLTLRPLTAAWTSLPELERRALLEFQLRKHTFLARGSDLSFQYHAHLPTFRFRVEETRPDAVVSITDSDVATEILPFEAADETMATGAPAAASASSSSSSAAAASSSASASSAAASASPAPMPKLVAGEPVSGKLCGAGDMLRFALDVSDPNALVSIDLKCVSGDVDLYVLNDSAAGGEVDVAFWSWASQQARGGSKTLLLSASDPLFRVGTWQVGVRAFGAEAEFTLTAQERANERQTAGAGHQLGSASAASSSSSSSSPASASSAAASSSSAAAAAAASSGGTVAPDATLCPTCKTMISAKALQMHSLQCARLNALCAQCGLVTKTSEREKHVALAHAVYTCLCGVQLQQAAMVDHKRNACSLRLTDCLYCPMRLVVAERGPHQFECGTLRSHCVQCADSIQRKMMRRHLIRAHGGINGKTDERDITWQDFWA